jgi:prepilin-type N-terminal cleavage/methylation domain-containing protein
MWRDNNSHTETRNAGRRGFTLVELLVSIAIFTTLMGGVVLVFVSSLRASQQGYQSISVQELARNTMIRVEGDLGSAFTSRDFGAYYNLYGTPIGFVFLGVANSTTSPSPSAKVNLARVTYVIHRTEGFKVYESADATDIGTFSLLRFSETGQDNLETFFVDWTDPVLEAELDEARARIVTNPSSPLYDPSTDCQGCVPMMGQDVKERLAEEAVKAKKRELWIRLLSGDPTLPDIWAYWDDLADGIVGNGLGNDGKEPRDYLIAEGIRLDEFFVQTKVFDSGKGVYVEQTLSPSLPYDGQALFAYGRVQVPDEVDINDELLNPQSVEFPQVSYTQGAQGYNTLLRRYWNDVQNMNAWNGARLVFTFDLVDFQLNGLGSPMLPEIPRVVAVNLDFNFESPHTGAPDFQIAQPIERLINIPAAYRRPTLRDDEVTEFAVLGL